MNHGNGERESVGDEMRRIAQRYGLGATGRHPQGKISETDEGEIKLAVGIESNKVVLNFGKQVMWIGFDADGALQLAEALTKHANKIKEMERAGK